MFVSLKLNESQHVPAGPLGSFRAAEGAGHQRSCPWLGAMEVSSLLFCTLGCGSLAAT